MSNSEEKLLILKMLEEGKITSEEAAKLIEALDGGERPRGAGEGASRQQKQPNFQDEVHKARERINNFKKEFKQNYNQSDFDRMVDEFSNKAEKLGKNLASTTFGLVDRMIDFVGSFVDTNAFNIFGSYTAVEKNFEVPAAEGMELYIEAVNGPILVKKHLENTIIIKSRVKSPQNNVDSILQFEDKGNSVAMKLNKPGNISVSHEVFLPALKFKSIKFETNNAKIYVEDTLSESFLAVTRNGHIELMGVNSDIVDVGTKNGKIQVGYVIGKNIDINTTNSVIDIKHIKAENINAANTNGRIYVENVQNRDTSYHIDLSLKTTNGGIKVNMNDMDNRGYKVKARTTNGGVNLLIPEMTYHHLNRQGTDGTFVEAESSGYDSYLQKVSVKADTVNGYIEIVK